MVQFFFQEIAPGSRIRTKILLPSLDKIMRIDLFQMERTQVQYEHTVQFNLSESGVVPLELSELVGDDVTGLLSTRLGYPWGNGSPKLREHVADFYKTSPENVTITNGSSEAIFIAFWNLLEKGDRAAIQLPNYLQAWGLARYHLGKADAYHIVRTRDGSRWELDVESLHRAVSKQTKVILVTNPNNPAGSVLTEKEMDEIVKAARKAGAWIVADEVYRGAELNGSDLTPTFWGRYSKVLVTSGLSKAFGMPGLRIGWIAGPAKQISKLEMYRDYLTLTPTMISDILATIAMEPGRRKELLQRTRNIVRSQLPVLEEWIHSHSVLLSYTAPVAGAIAFLQYRLPISSVVLFERLRKEHSVLITPAAHFGIKGKYFRVGYGYDVNKLKEGLNRISEFLSKWTQKNSAFQQKTSYIHTVLE
jgi:aspartate/methionine/tyrosine aminotransferase